MSQWMRAVVVDGEGGIALQDKAVPSPGPLEVLIAVQATGVCGTDLHLIEGSYGHGRYPVTPGHEFSGVVARTGREVSHVREGDFVGVDPNISCGHCRWCLTGAKNLCADIKPIGVAVDGSAADYVNVPADVVHRLPDQLGPVLGALVEPLSCVLHAVHRTPGWKDAIVAVYGAGPIGLLSIAVAKHLGAAHVAAIEPHPLRREMALTLGADITYTDGAELHEETHTERQVDIAVDASGHPGAIQSAIDTLGRRGRLVQMGVAHEDALVQLSPYQVFAKELMIIGAQSLADAYPAAVDLMPDIATVLAPMVTDQLTLESYSEAAERAGSPLSVKVQVISDVSRLSG